MEYKLSFKEDTVPVEVETSGDNSLTASIGDDTHQISYSVVDEHHIRLYIDGKGINAYVSGSSDEKSIVIDGMSYKIGDADAAAMQGAKKSRGGQTPDTVTPPMPAAVVKVLVNEGDTVEKGQALVVVSAMKMETTLSAPYSGTVTKINTAEGEKVMPGDILVDIEKDEQDEEKEEDA